MKINSITAEEYEKVCSSYQYFYNSVQFHRLNQDKVDAVEYLVFGEKKKKLALAIGFKDGVMKIPYSAPFGVFEKLQPHIKLEEIEEAMYLLERRAKEKNLSKIFYRVPPIFYDESFLSKLQNVLLRSGYQIESCDLNYQFFLESIDTYEDKILRNARKNLKKARQHGFLFVHCNMEVEKKEAYEVIAKNRKRKGYPLRMTYQQVMDTVQLTEHDFFLLKDGGENVAAAIVFRVNEHCYQVIYWGDVEGYADKRPMNLLAYEVYAYYVDKGIQVLDIGPSTEDGIPNYGLCDFKESIGCTMSSKYTFVKGL